MEINDNFRQLIAQNGGPDGFSLKYDYTSKIIREYLDGTRNPCQMTIRSIAGDLKVDWHSLVK